ncbi:BglG family transcription antiterminator [Halalkalibacter nanhaiisediminis]|uniref:Ascorbate-specific PTS system EIIA component n=1 Tax=Halalkalibacter nanhaiisediminis TaxID=688079 RepID=A0A562QRG0_9BACI|nr:BglG family transcription antiterminator [Halalkalibacter nanhaiisediminis]TWI59314.1 transcriptional antiterminator [Halalkalibacter nanhaiisediminis]
MYLDERSNLILKEVVANPDISNKDLENKFQLSRRQISYSFTKINDWLKGKNYPVISRTNGGKFIVNPVLIGLFAEKRDDSSSATYIPSEKERAEFIILMLLSGEEELSLVHFSSALQVSKNTILRDMKLSHTIVSEYKLEIVYSRMNGYEVSGSEWDKRRLFIDVLRKVFEIYKGETYIQKLANISVADIEKLKLQMEEVENKLHLKFIDERIKILPYIIAALLKRMKKGNLITGSYQIDYDELSDTKEFEAAEILIQGIKDIPKEERLFITLQLLTSNVLSSQVLTETELPQLKESLKSSLELFEKKACILFKEKKALLERLVLHMKPAYYRIKYSLTTNYSILDKVSEEFEAIHFIVKDSIRPFEDYIGSPVPESEIMFITIFIGGHLINSGETISFKKRAVVVCPNGVSISRLMENTLRDLFPEFYFYEAFSIREFERQTELEFDIVFSPVALQTEKHLFIVDQFISDFEKTQLRQRVMQAIFGLNSSVVKIDQLLSVIDKHAKIENKIALEKALQDYFSFQFSGEMKQKKDYGLTDFIIPETVILEESVEIWQDALSIASQPLLDRGNITENYVETMKTQYSEMTPNIVLRLNIAIPHARPIDGVNKVGMSLLRIKDGLTFKDQEKVHFIVVIAAIDKHQHLNALLQLMKLAEMNDVLEEMLHAPNSNELVNLVANSIK